MSLFDLPQLDPSAINSAASERKLEASLNETAGFICRREEKDKGCDYMAELIQESAATGHKFPIQLKSIEHINIVFNDTYISYPVKTSRLRYMLEHLPTTGIFVFYSVEKDQCFYDFSDAVYERLKAERDSDEWAKNGTVNIRIPLCNILDETGIQGLKQTMTARFAKHAQMQMANGKKYGLPVIDLLTGGTFDPYNVEHLKQLLKKWGFWYLTQYDIGILFGCLSKLTLQEINSDKDLLILAALSYCEVGKYLESDLFQRYANSKFTLTEQEKSMLAYIDLKNQLQLGNIPIKTFREGLEKLKDNSDNNNLIIDINILRYKLTEDTQLLNERANTLELYQIFDRIDRSQLPESTKQTYTLWNAMNESLIIENALNYNLTVTRSADAVGSPLSDETKRSHLTAFSQNERNFAERINKIYAISVSKKNDYLQATVLQVSALHFLQRLISFIAMGISIEGLDGRLKHHTSEAARSYDLFAEAGLLRDAYFSISIAVELLDAIKAFTDSNVDTDYQHLSQIMAAVEKELMIEPSQKIIQSTIADKKKMQETRGTRPAMSSLKDMSDKQLEVYAKIGLQSLDLPEDRSGNMLTELKAYRFFYNRCNNQDIEVLQDNSSMYVHPVQFILRNKTTGISTVASTDMEYLLQSWGF